MIEYAVADWTRTRDFSASNITTNLPWVTPGGTVGGCLNTYHYPPPQPKTDLPYIVQTLAQLLDAGKISEETFRTIIAEVARR